MPQPIDHHPIQKRHLWSSTLAFIAWLATPALAEPADMTQFFGEFPSCRTSNEFDYLMRVTMMRFVYEDDNYSTARLPAHHEAAIGEPVVKQMSDHIEVEFTVSGAYSNIPLSGLTLWIGNESGIAAAQLEFAATAREVRMWYGSAVDATNRAAANSEAMSPRATIPDTEPGSIFCDWST